MKMGGETLCANLEEITGSLLTNGGDSSPLEATAVPDVNMLQESDAGKSWKAYVLSRVGKDDIDHFSHIIFSLENERKFVSQMTKRELELVVKKFLKGKQPSTDHEDVPSNQGEKSMKVSVESDFEELKKALNKAIASIQGTDPDSRNSWISALENLCKEGVDQLISASE